jgi:catechol 2,3-dioxygenase
MSTAGAGVRPYTSVSPEHVGVQPPGFRLPAATRIGRVILQIADLDRSLAFYQDVLGFRVASRVDVPGQRAALLTAQNEERPLLELRERPQVRPVPKRGRLGIYHFALLLPSRADLGRFIRHAAQRGVRMGGGDHFYSEATYLVDPDGITVEVYQDRPRSGWAVSQAGEIVGGTEPLDFEGIVREGGDLSYRGLPRGTTIGHMHFFVGDLARAESFYHEAFGFAKVNWTAPGMLFVAAGAYHHHVGLNTFAAGSPVATEEDAKLVTWELVVPDQAAADDAVASLRRAGASVTPSGSGYIARDPWGIAVAIRTESDRG